MAILIREKLTQYSATTLVALSLVAGVCSLLFSWLFWAKFHIDIPIEDILRLIPTAQAVVENGWSSVTLQEWLAPHASAHRIAIGRLLMAMEYKYFSGHNDLLYLSMWLSIGALCYLYFLVSRLPKPSQPDTSWFMLGMALVYTLSYSQFHNLIFPVNSLWYISSSCSALSVYLVVSRGNNLTLISALAACLFAIVAAFSVFSGVITCLMVALLTIQCRSRHAFWVPILLVLFVVFYLQDLKSGQAHILQKMTGEEVDVTLVMHIQSLVVNHAKVFQYTVNFLSAPLSKSAPLLSYVYVVPSLCLILFGWIAVIRAFFRGDSEEAIAHKFYLAMATIFLGTAIACFMGRAFQNAATAPRYQTVVMLYWLSVSGLLLHTLPIKSHSALKIACMILIVLLPVGLLYNKHALKITPVVNESNEASDIEITTQLGFPNFHDPSHPRNKFTPMYIEYESFLANNTSLARKPATARQAQIVDPDICQSMRVSIKPRLTKPDSSMPISDVKLSVKHSDLQRFRRVRMAGPEGHYGELYFKHTHPSSIPDLIWGSTQWQGYYGGSKGSQPIILTFDAVLGPDFQCQLATDS
ncbi:Uncharacterised protein [Halioglobus japonicus]|nr:Uncharacterised protein [Halioglobus japonicus]